MKSKSHVTGFDLKRVKSHTQDSIYEELVSGSYRAQQQFFKQPEILGENEPKIVFGFHRPTLIKIAKFGSVGGNRS